MNSQRQTKDGATIPWAPLIGAAAIGAVAFLVAKRIQTTRTNRGGFSLDSAMRACDRAADALEQRLDGNRYAKRLAS
jgi:hypothetical protein